MVGKSIKWGYSVNTFKGVSIFNLTVKKSKFLGFGYRVDSIEEAEEIISSLKNKFYDAKHIVYAYKIGDNIVRKENSSEPSGTASVPILAVIENSNLTNTLILIIRYFGGALLGASNLYRAYSDTAVGVVKNGEIVTLNKYYKFVAEVSYVEYAKLNSYANKTNDLVILDGTFETVIKIIFAVKEGTSNKEILNLINGKESKETIWL